MNKKDKNNILLIIVTFVIAVTSFLLGTCFESKINLSTNEGNDNSFVGIYHTYNYGSGIEANIHLYDDQTCAMPKSGSNTYDCKWKLKDYKIQVTYTYEFYSGQPESKSAEFIVVDDGLLYGDTFYERIK